MHGTAAGRTQFRYFRLRPVDRQWGLFATTVGRSEIMPNSRYPPAEHPGGYQLDWQSGRMLREFQLIFITDGGGWFETRQARLRIRSGDMLLLRPGLWHRYKPDAQTGWREQWIGFDGSYARYLFKRELFAAEKPVLSMREQANVLECFENIARAAQRASSAAQQLLSGYIIQLLGLFYASTQVETKARERENRVVQQALAQLQSEDGASLSLPGLARKLHLSYSLFRRVFREHVGMSPHQYRIHLKVVRAGHMLKETNLPLKQIAAECGFGSEQYFCRVLKRVTGQTAVQLRTGTL